MSWLCPYCGRVYPAAASACPEDGVWAADVVPPEPPPLPPLEAPFAARLLAERAAVPLAWRPWLWWGVATVIALGALAQWLTQLAARDRTAVTLLVVTLAMLGGIGAASFTPATRTRVRSLLAGLTLTLAPLVEPLAPSASFRRRRRVIAQRQTDGALLGIELDQPVQFSAAWQRVWIEGRPRPDGVIVARRLTRGPGRPALTTTRPPDWWWRAGAPLAVLGGYLLLTVLLGWID